MGFIAIQTTTGIVYTKGEGVGLILCFIQEFNFLGYPDNSLGHVVFFLYFF